VLLQRLQERDGGLSAAAVQGHSLIYEIKFGRGIRRSDDGAGVLLFLTLLFPWFESRTALMDGIGTDCCRQDAARRCARAG
jgi:hypothetical protein